MSFKISFSWHKSTQIFLLKRIIMQNCNVDIAWMSTLMRKSNSKKYCILGPNLALFVFTWAITESPFHFRVSVIGL